MQGEKAIAWHNLVVEIKMYMPCMRYHVIPNILQYGWLSLAPTPFPLVPALQKALTVRGYWLAEITMNPERLARAKNYVYDRVQSGQLKPKIAKTFRLEVVVEAYRYMESNEQIGKIVLTIGN